jgi:surface antigen
MMRQACLLILCVALAVPAASVTWMRDAVVTDFTDSDWDILRREVNRVLNTVADDVEVSWENPETGSRGMLKVLTSFEHNGQRCRHLAAMNINSKGRKGQMDYNLCLQPDGAWKFVSESAIK